MLNILRLLRIHLLLIVANVSQMEPKRLFALKLNTAVRTVERTFYHTFVSFWAFLARFFGRPHLSRKQVIGVLACGI